ncbi:Mu transposase C-terminal domain-containing protein [Vibrio breoganii]
MPSDSKNIFGFFDEFESSECETQKIPTELFQEPIEISSTIDSQPKKVQLEVLRRVKIINFVEKRLKGGWTEKNLNPILRLAEAELQIIPPSWRTIVTWKKVYFESGKDPCALIPKHMFKGNRQKEIDSQSLIDEAIKNIYLTRERLSIAEAFRYYKSRVIQINRGIVEGKIKPIAKRSFYNRIHDLPPYEVAVARFGKRYADREFRPVGQQVVATKPMEYVEIDHTPVPVILIDDELDIPLGRPYLTMLYDRYSKCIVGCSVNFREPSFDSVRKALLNSLLDKSWVKQRYPSIENEWPCHGKIDCLVVDNGAEFWSQSLEDSLRPLVSDIQYSQAAKPWRKSGIEKLFDQMNKGLVNALPGKTFTNPTQLQDYNPKKDAVVRVSVFLELLHKWIVDYYHMSPDSRERDIPYHKWNQSEWTPSYYAGIEEEQLRVELGLLRHRTIGVAGIRLHNLRYQSPELIDYRKYCPSNSGKKLFVKTKTDPSDISYIHVYLESKNKYIKVPAVDNSGYTSGLSLFEHERIQKVRRLNTRQLADDEALADTFLYMKKRIQEETDRFRSAKSHKTSLPKTGNTSKLAKFNDVGSEGPASINTTPVNNEFKAPEQLADDDFEGIEGY